ncbi:MAG: polysaccharide deacetylase family protein [Planctomycetota bacterium]
MLKAFGLLMVLSLVLLPACGHIQVFLLPVAESIGPEGTFRIDVGEEKLIALTIDDGPSTHTGQILDLLAENNATATFFIHADHAAALGDAGQQVLQRVLAEGHELGNHTTADVVSVSLKPAEFEATFYAADAYLRSMDVEPRWFRTAGGTFNPEVMLPTVITAGYEPTFAMASFLPWDTFLHLPGVYGRQIGGAAFPGAILVLHEGIDDKAGRGERTLTTLRELFRVAENRGYRLRSLSEVVDYSRQVDAGQGL